MNILEARRRTLGKGVYKKTVEGNPAIAQGSLARRYPGITMQGWTEQDGTPTPEAPVPIVSAGKYNEETGKYEYEVKLTAKNVFVLQDLVDKVAETSNPAISVILTITGLKPSTRYTLSASIDGSVSGDYTDRCLYLNGNDGQSAVYRDHPVTRMTSVDGTISIWFYDGRNESQTILDGQGNVQLEEGGSATEYEEYKEQLVSLTSDRQLTKWDKLEKRNGQWGWVYKSAEIESYTDESVPGEYYSTTGQLSVGAQVWYETATKTFVPLSHEEQKQMNALHTFRPTTVLSNDCGCNMKLTYKTKKSLGVTD